MMEPDPPQPADPKKPFWPTREEARHVTWAFLLCLYLPLAMLVPLLFLMPLLLLPNGDQGWLVALRIAIVVGFALAYRRWIDLVVGLARRIFSGKLSPAMEAGLHAEDPPPTSPWAVLRANLMLVGFAGLGFAVWFGYLDLKSPLWKVDHLPKKFRGLVAILQWCQGHPQTVHASAAVIAVGSVLWLGARMFAAHRAKARDGLTSTHSRPIQPGA